MNLSKVMFVLSIHLTIDCKSHRYFFWIFLGKDKTHQSSQSHKDVYCCDRIDYMNCTYRSRSVRSDWPLFIWIIRSWLHMKSVGNFLFCKTIQNIQYLATCIFAAQVLWKRISSNFPLFLDQSMKCGSQLPRVQAYVMSPILISDNDFLILHNSSRDNVR